MRRIVTYSVICAASNHCSLIFCSQGDTLAWDIQVHDQRIKEATEKARHETFGEYSLMSICGFKGWEVFRFQSSFLHGIQKNIKKVIGLGCSRVGKYPLNMHGLQIQSPAPGEERKKEKEREKERGKGKEGRV